MIISLLLSAGIGAACLLAGRILMHYFQLESYQFPGYFRSVKRNFLKALIPGICLSLLLFLSFLLISLVVSGPDLPVPVFLAETALLPAGGFIIGKTFSEKHAKKAFVFTPRAKRLYFVSFLVLTLIPFAIQTAFGQISFSFGVSGILIILFPVFLPLWTALSGLLAWPVEKGISEMYFRDAQRILKSRTDLIRIGITGSWGKTSVKFILGTMLEEKYHTLVTPASFNTPMGVTKVIRSRLEPGHRVFVAEMGARHVGDIKEMCRLVHPHFGLITSVGPQHLDTFKTIDRIIRTKYELIEALPPDGCSFFSDDEGICRKLYEKTDIPKMISGLDPDRCDVRAENISVSGNGSSFDLCTDSLRIKCETKLLGELNIRNILLCACVCIRLGMSGEQIARGISKVRPVEHRLQLIDNPGGITVIDDAFNSNINGAIQAFKVLKEMNGKRILVTPGMVELGAQEESLNHEFGKKASDCCDLAILIGKKRSAAISAGLKDGGFDPESILVCSSLDEATVLLRSLAKAGDTILFENDLPDNYTE